MHIEEFLGDIERRLSNLIKIGTIKDIVENKVIVKTADLTTKPLPYLTQRSGDCVTWWSPSVGEQVMILSPCGELNNGVVLPSIPTKKHTVKSSTVHSTKYADGTTITYDYHSHTLNVDAVGDINIKAQKINIIGDINVKGSIKSTKDIQANGVSLLNHTHIDSQSKSTQKPS